jgi:OmpA-OmpF porin, OOP family
MYLQKGPKIANILCRKEQFETMSKNLAMTVILGAAMLTGGCATKKYVRNTTAPIQAKVDQVGDQTNKNSTSIDESRKEIKAVDERAETGISAAKERAMTADNHAGEAMTKANEAIGIATEARNIGTKNTSELESLRHVVNNIDDYKPVAETTVNFAFGKDKLSPDAQAALDKLAADKGAMKRFVVAVEGFTDKTGSAEFNAALSQRRANAVVNYLVTKYDIPLYRIYMVGLGSQKPADEGRNREARSKNRRVEVKIYSADQTMASRNSAADAPSTTR